MYNLKESKEMLKEKYGWQDYYEKHCESLFTWWFQNYYLFEKFGFDKRKAHYSSLINSGQMTRKEAMDLLADRPVYPELGQVLNMKAMNPAKHRHEDYPMDKWYDRIAKIIKFLRWN